MNEDTENDLLEEEMIQASSKKCDNCVKKFCDDVFRPSEYCGFVLKI